MDVVSGIATAVVTAVILVTGLVIAGFIVLFRRRGDRGIRAAGPNDLGSLTRRAGSLLVAVDDALRDADQELGYAIAQFGADRARPYAAALTEARTKVTEAFRLRQLLDDSVPDSDRQRREWTLQVIALCEQAQRGLDSQDREFAALRALEVNAAGTLDDVRRRLADAQTRLGTARGTLTDLRSRYDDAVVAAVAGHPEAAERELAQAAALADAAAPGISQTGVNAVATTLLESGLAVQRADALLDAVDRTARDLTAASAALDTLRSTTETDLTEARAQVDTAPDADTGQAIIDAIAATEKALRGADGSNPVADLDAIGDAVADLDLALKGARNQAQRLEHARTAYAGTLVSAQNQISAAKDFIRTHGGGAEARTRLAEADRQVALAAAAADPVEALDTIRRAVTLARDADALARYDTMGSRGR
jgi:hypothetical protein